MQASALMQDVAMDSETAAMHEVRNDMPASSDLLAHTDFHRLVYCILGLPIDAMSLDQATRKLQGAARRRIRCFLSTPNLNFLVWSHADPGFRDSVIRSDLSVADGMPLVWIARAMGIPIRERLAGSSLFERINKETYSSMSVYFFGGPDGAACRAADTINSGSTKMTCVGYNFPGFGTIEDMSDTNIIREINENHPDFLVVALGAKKGQAWIERNLYAIAAPIVSHLGAVVNIVAGNISRAPFWMQRLGLEWAWRIKEEPALWKRYISDGGALVRLVVTRVIPCLFYQRYVTISRDRFLRSTVASKRANDTCKLILEGPWNESNLTPLRKALTDVTSTPCDIVVDLGAVDYADSAFVGLCILLYGHQSKLNRRLRFDGVTTAMRRIFKAHCVEYLIQPDGVKVGRTPRPSTVAGDLAP
jgi:N-acetylglucosaminyldiphosphoundecaprenol N-acetyl-beta-D-mannosaminyltransferase